MSKATITHEHASHEAKSHGCGCGGAHATHQKTQPAQKENAIPQGDRKDEHAHQSGGDAGCCGGGKAKK